MKYALLLAIGNILNHTDICFLVAGFTQLIFVYMGTTCVTCTPHLHELNLMVIETTYKNNSVCVNTLHYAWIASFHYQRYFFKN